MLGCESPAGFTLAVVSQSDKSGDNKIGTVSLLHHSASYLMFQWSMSTLANISKSQVMLFQCFQPFFP